ncbi:MAG: DUF5131 family protein [Pirellulaceae bacterium]
MAENTKIQWATHTWNPWIGCSKVHTGCTHCYAEADFAMRRKRVEWGVNGTRVKTSDEYWRRPLKWNREAAGQERPRVFPSLCDPFEEWSGPIFNSGGHALRVCPSEPLRYVPESLPWEKLLAHERRNIELGHYRRVTMDDLRREMFELIRRTPRIDWLLLTKRPENLRRMWSLKWTLRGHDHPTEPVSLKNAWLIYSASDQASLEAGLSHLLECRNLVPVLGLSLEPLVGPVDLAMTCLGGAGSTGIDWVIVGGESGPNARPCNVEWIRSIVAQCREANVPCFVKQLGACCVDNDPVSRCSWPGLTQFRVLSVESDGRLHDEVVLSDSKGGDPAEWPEDLRVRQFPYTAVNGKRGGDE